jgi:hypothetical protein
MAREKQLLANKGVVLIMKQVRSLSFPLFVFLAMILVAHGQTSGSTVTAASCKETDVNAVINGPTHIAADGDVIQIPSGSCTWTSKLTVPSGIGITLIGAGTPNGGASTQAPNASCTGTTITDGVTGNMLIQMTPTYGNSISRISCIKFLPASPWLGGSSSPMQINGTCTSSGCPNLRLDNLTIPSNWTGLGINDDTFADLNNMYGVADHSAIGSYAPSDNGVDFINPTYSTWNGTGQYGDESWAAADSYGTNRTFYIENNTFNYAFGTDTDSNLGTGGGGRFVCRFNSFSNVTQGSACTNHGTETTGRARGGRQAEAYNNTLSCSNTSQGCTSGFGFRSGVALVFDNTYTAQSGSWFNSYVALADFRMFSGFSPWGYCDGQSPYDDNDGTTYYSGIVRSISTTGGTLVITDLLNPGWTSNQWVVNGNPYTVVVTSALMTIGSWSGYPGFEVTGNTSNSLSASSYGADYWNGPPVFLPGDTYKVMRSTYCIDQPGRAPSSYISGTTPSPTGWVSEPLDPVYEWGDTHTGSFNHNPINSDSLKMINNRDYYYEVSQSAQSSPTSPFNGTVGTGFGTIANRPTTCTAGVAYWATDQGNWNQSGSGGQGQLFKCTATNTWTMSYQPYTYPHPLITGGTTETGPNPPTGLTRTVQTN